MDGRRIVLAQAIYCDNPDLTEFKAYGSDDLYVDSSSTETL
jgi:hypothetical protein